MWSLRVEHVEPRLLRLSRKREHWEHRDCKSAVGGEKCKPCGVARSVTQGVRGDIGRVGGAVGGISGGGDRRGERQQWEE